MLELTTLEGLPLFINVTSIESVTQEKTSTAIVTFSGTKHSIQEHAIDVVNDIVQYASAISDMSSLN